MATRTHTTMTVTPIVVPRPIIYVTIMLINGHKVGKIPFLVQIPQPHQGCVGPWKASPRQNGHNWSLLAVTFLIYRWRTYSHYIAPCVPPFAAVSSKMRSPEVTSFSTDKWLPNPLAELGAWTCSHIRDWLQTSCPLVAPRFTIWKQSPDSK